MIDPFAPQKILKLGDSTDPALARQQLGNMGEDIQKSFVTTLDGVQMVHAQNGIIEVTKITSDNNAAECLLGPITETSAGDRTWNEDVTQSSTDMVLSMVVKHLKQISCVYGSSAGNGITIGFSSPYVAAQASLSPVGIAEQAYGTRKYYDSELVFTGTNEAGTDPNWGTGYAVRRIKQLYFTYKKKAFSWTLSDKSSATDGSGYSTCINGDATERPLWSRVYSSTKGIVEATFVALNNKLFKLTLAGTGGLLGPIDYMPSPDQHFMHGGYNLLNLAEIEMFGQPWHGVVHFAQSDTPFIVLNNGTTRGLLSHRIAVSGVSIYPITDGMPDTIYFRHPSAGPVTQPADVIAQGAEFKPDAILYGVKRNYDLYSSASFFGSSIGGVTVDRPWLCVADDGSVNRCNMRLIGSGLSYDHFKLAFTGESASEFDFDINSYWSFSSTDIYDNQPNPNGRKLLVTILSNRDHDIYLAVRRLWRFDVASDGTVSSPSEIVQPAAVVIVPYSNVRTVDIPSPHHTVDHYTGGQSLNKINLIACYASDGTEVLIQWVFNTDTFVTDDGSQVMTSFDYNDDFFGGSPYASNQTYVAKMKPFIAVNGVKVYEHPTMPHGVDVPKVVQISNNLIAVIDRNESDPSNQSLWMCVALVAPESVDTTPRSFINLKAAYNPRTKSIVVSSDPTDDIFPI